MQGLFLRIWLGVMMLAVTGLTQPVLEKPSIILLMADDLGYECLGCNGSEVYRTPNLDALARSGLRFTHCYSQPLCTPSRAQIMTGRYNHRNYTGFGVLDPGEITFGNLLKDAGYATGIVGKWQLGGDLDQPQRFGFEEHCLWQIQGRDQRYWQPRIVQNGKVLEETADRYGPDVLCDFALDFMQRHSDRPFFLYYPLCLTHDPFCPTPRTEGPKNEQRRGPEFFADMVEYMDDIVGRIQARVDALGLSQRTLILFTGDNGTHRSIRSPLGDRVIQGGKSLMTDAGTHVPLIASWPSVTPAGRVCDDLIDFSDFVPTFAALSGAVLPEDHVIDGRSFWPQLQGEAGVPREWVFCHYWGRGRVKENSREFARDKRYKLYDNGELFDLRQDPLEQQPLAPDALTPEAQQIKAKLNVVFAQLHSTNELSTTAKPLTPSRPEINPQP
jgi:arylsulfatase A